MSRRRKNPQQTKSDSTPRRDQSGATDRSKEKYDQVSGPQGTKPGDPGYHEDESKSKDNPNSSNDPDWYNADPQLLLDSASFPFAYPLGDVVETVGKVADTRLDTISNNRNQRSLAGLLALKIKPSYGFSYDMKDPLNVCANAFYTHVRYVNSGRKNYDAPDLMLYALMFAEIYSAIFWLQRIYRIAFTYSQRNKFIGDALLEANGVQPKSIRDNLANFRYRLNAFINKVSSFVVPANINIFKRRAFMYTGLYLENRDGNIKDQLYMFVPAGFYKFRLDGDGKGMLGFEEWNYTSASWSVLMDYVEDLMQNITGDEDFGLMSGDILKAYGQDIIGISPMAEEDYIMPIHDPYVLSQFKNAAVVSQLAYGNNAATFKVTNTGTEVFTTGDLYQDKNGHLLSVEALIKSDSRKHSLIYWGLRGSQIMSVENPVPGPADSIEASRLMVGCKQFTDIIADVNNQGYVAGELLEALVCGSELVVGSKIYQFDTLGLIDFSNGDMANWIPIPDSGSIDLAQVAAMQYYTVSLAFKYHPNLLGMIGHERADSVFEVSIMTYLSNIDNYTILARTELEKMHECALLSLFFVPGVAKMVNYM